MCKMFQNCLTKFGPVVVQNSVMKIVFTEEVPKCTVLKLQELYNWWPFQNKIATLYNCVSPFNISGVAMNTNRHDDI